MLVLRIILGLIAALVVAGAVYFAVHPDPPGMLIAAPAAVLGFLILVLYFAARPLVRRYARRRARARGFPIQHPRDPSEP